MQFVALALLLLGDAVDAAGDVGSAALWAAALITLYTGYNYLSAGLRHMSAEDSLDKTTPVRNRAAPGRVD